MYTLLAVVFSIFTIFKCANSSVEWRKQTSVHFLLNNSMSDFDDTAAFDREIETFMKQWRLIGASFALMKGDSLIYAKGYGYADKEQEIECEVDNVFRIASASKLLTATAIMKLVEQDKLSLDSQVFGEEGILCDTMFLNLKYKNLEDITVEHLLRHTAGFSSPLGDPAFANYNVARFLGKELPLTVDDMVYYATQNRLLSRPGGSYKYSNLGYVILGKVVEVAAKEDYESYMQNSILAPAGCYDVYIGQNFSQDRDSNEVQYYEVEEAEPVEAYDGSGELTMKSNGGNNVTLLAGAGGWVASPTELLRFVASINGESGKKDILSKESVKKMTQYSTRQKPIGWASVTTKEWSRSGSMAGTSAFIKRQSNGYTWVFITNSSSWNGYRLNDLISSYVTRAIAKVKRWPQRDLFVVDRGNEQVDVMDL